MSGPTRRDALRLGAVLGAAAAVAGCTSNTSGRPVSSTSAASSGGSTASSATASAATSGSAQTSTPASSATSSARPTRPTFEQLEKRLSGPLYRPGQKGYHPQALLYNPRFADQQHPQAIARCANAADVAACVSFAADGGAPLRIRNGGHSYGGWSSGPGLVVDLGSMNSVSVNHGAGTATIGAGARLVDVYSRLGADGVSIGAGSCPTVGITGLTLGGGVGVLSRAYGLTCDQLLSARVVSADGKLRTVDAQHDADLFWALRGGGGSFGAVTELTFHVRPAPSIDRFFLQWPASAATAVLAAWQEWMDGAPRELWSTCKVLADPGHGMHASVAGTWVGSGSASGQLARLLAHVPRPSSQFRARNGYTATMLAEAGCSAQSAGSCTTSALSPAKRQAEAASSAILTKALPTAGVQAIVEAVSRGLDVPGLVEGGVSFDAFGGAVAQPSAAATAFPWRSALADVQYTATWPYARATQDTGRYDAFVAAERKALLPWCGQSAYVNYADPALQDFAGAYWGSNLARLRSIRRAVDPHGVFSFPQAVPL